MMEYNLSDNKRIRVLLIIRWPVGGIRTFIRYVYTNFDSKKYLLTIVAPLTSELQVLIADLKEYDVTYMELPPIVSPLQILSSIFKVIKVIKHQKFDLVHSHGLTAGIISAIPAWLNKIPHVLTIHDVFNKTQFQNISGYAKKTVLSFILPIINVIHMVSYDSKQNLLDFLPIMKMFNSKLMVIPNGIKIEQFSSVGQRNLRKEYSLPSDVFLVGFFGRFMSQKGFTYLVEAVEILRNKGSAIPQKPLILSFSAEDGFYWEERKKIKDKGIDDYFLFLPFTPDVASTMKGLDLVVMPSLWEASGLVAMEAMVAGVPFIGTDCIGLRETLRDTPAKVVAMRDSVALAEAILSEMIQSSRVMAESFQIEASQRFDVKKQAKELERIFHNLIK